MLPRDEIVERLVALLGGGVEPDELEATLEIPRSDENGDLALPCFRLARARRQHAAGIASDLADRWASPELAEVWTSGGFLNFRVRHASPC